MKEPQKNNRPLKSWTEDELDALSEISDDDIDEAIETTSPEMKKLLLAKSDEEKVE